MSKIIEDGSVDAIMPAERVRRFYEQFSRDVEGSEPAGIVVDRHHTTDVVQVSDGVRIDHGRLVNHIAPLRRQGMRFLGVDVHEAVGSDNTDGENVAARLTLRAALRGREKVTEIHFFGHFTADGRLRRAHLLTRPLRDAAQDTP